MPRQNRVTPRGDLISATARGMFWGNRGALLDRGGDLARYSRGRGWVVCVLEFNNRHREQWKPGRLTEIYFLDEATALAAGHRPCGECRAVAYRAFRAAWATAHPGRPLSAPAIDAQLHIDRLTDQRMKRTYVEDLAALPDSTMIEVEGDPWLVLGPELLAWTPTGYQQRRPRPEGSRALVLTPRSTVATLAAGYEPVLHPSAQPAAEAARPG